MRTLAGATLLLIFAALPAHAQLQADFNHAVDGDTANLDIHLTEHLIYRGNVRLGGVDAPELRGKCEQEKLLATEARDYVDQALSAAGSLVVFPVTWSDKYGRPVVKIMIDGDDLGEQLQREGLARAYDGGRRAGWCD